MTQSTKKLYRSLTTGSAFVVGTHRHMGGRFQEMRIGPSIIWEFSCVLVICLLVVARTPNCPS